MSEEQFNIMCKIFETTNQTIINLARDMEKNITLLNIKIDESIARLDAKIDNLAQKVDKLEQRIDKLEQRMDKLEQRMNKLEQRMDNIENRLSKLEEEQFKTNQKIDDLYNQVDALTFEFKCQTKYIGTLFQRVGKLDGLTLNEEDKRYLYGTVSE